MKAKLEEMREGAQRAVQETTASAEMHAKVLLNYYY